MEQLVRDVPPITLTYMLGAFLTTAACQLELLSPFSLYLNFRMVASKGQVWRLVTNFLFFGQKFSLDFLFHMFFLARYCKSLEESSFRGRTADFFWMLLFGAVTMTALAPVFQLNFLGHSLTFMMVYVWARRNPFGRMNFLGVFNFTAPYLPWVLALFSLALNGESMTDFIGIGVGHTYYFLEDVYPRMLPGRPRLLKTPRFIEYLFGVPPPNAPVPFPNVVPPVAPVAADAGAAAAAADGGMRDDPVPAAVIPDAIAAPHDA